MGKLKHIHTQRCQRMQRDKEQGAEEEEEGEEAEQAVQQAMAIEEMQGRMLKIEEEM